jgi:hypothetical protein
LAARKELAAHYPGAVVFAYENGPAWWPGEVNQYRDLLCFTDGTKGELFAKTALDWAFRRDPHNTGLVSGWAYKPVDLTYWKGLKNRGNIASHQNNPGNWEMLRTDLYMQAQGVIHPNYHNYNGYAWYRTEVKIKEKDAASQLRLRFPGLLNECWLYVNGALVAHRDQKPLWWKNDYKFEWDVDVKGKLKSGVNTLALRLHNPHHMGGMFRRPFLYRKTE